MRERLRHSDTPPRSAESALEVPASSLTTAAPSAFGFNIANIAIFSPERDGEQDSAVRGVARQAADDSGDPSDGSSWFGEAVSSPLERARETAGAYWNHDLRAVNVHERHPAFASSPVDALTVGRDVYLNPRLDSASEHGQHVLAHEFAHTVQQSRSVSGSDADLEADAERDAHASRAQPTGTPDAFTPPSSLARPPLPAPAQPRAQAFDPRYHRESLVNGLSENKETGEAASGFTPEEIGAIYAANWERDLSQAHPSLGNVILAWKAVKLTAVQPGAREDSVKDKEAAFVAACASVLEQVKTQGVDAFSNAQASYRDGDKAQGYNFWEHMDNPGAGLDAAIKKADVKLQMPTDTKKMPTHIVLSREYIKQMLFEAVQQAYPDASQNSDAGKAAAGSRANSEALRGANLNSSVPKDGKPLPPQPTVLPGVTAGANAHDTSAAVRADTAAEVRDTKGGMTPVGAHLAGDRRYELLGRASHALEDFWAHSNFVEVAIGEPKHNAELASIAGITTGTFDDGDKKHALAHKIRSISDEIESERGLVEHATGRSKRLPAPEEVQVGDISRPTPESGHDEAHSELDLALRFVGALGEADADDANYRNPATFGAAASGALTGYLAPDNPLSLGLGTAAGAVVGGIAGGIGGLKRGGLLDGALGLAKGSVSGGYGGIMGSVAASQAKDHSAAGGALAGATALGNENLVRVAFSLGASTSGVALLRAVAEKLEADSRDAQKNQPESHTNLAKDQPGHDGDAQDALKTAKFNLAHALSSAADRKIIGKMHAVLEAGSAAAAVAGLEEINRTLDTLIAPPDNHPLSGIIDAHRAQAEAALNARYGK